MFQNDRTKCHCRQYSTSTLQTSSLRLGIKQFHWLLAGQTVIKRMKLRHNDTFKWLEVLVFCHGLLGLMRCTMVWCWWHHYIHESLLALVVARVATRQCILISTQCCQTADTWWTEGQPRWDQLSVLVWLMSTIVSCCSPWLDGGSTMRWQLW